ncbi:MAG TPA: ABC transporter ATP-binding protein [Gemmatimonadaceae bacterium]|nr:ABC transporter ATP-binding protein [Gemmatimonadaceae bacterium]
MIEFDNVGKTYRSLFGGREVRALDQLSLTVGAGEVLGIAGPNGAGKSTLISVLLGYLPPTEGEVRIAGLAPRAYVERHGVGYLSELVAIPPRWTVSEALERYAVLGGVRDEAVSLRVDEIVERLGLDEHRAKQVKALSKGNRQRLGLAQALLRGERLFVLDEPTHGLDPLWTSRFREVVAALRHPARAIVIASHNLEELERLCDRVAILDRGQLQRVVEVTRLLPMTQAVVYRLTVAQGAEMLESVFPGAVDLGRGDWAVRADDIAALNRGLGELIARGTLLAGVAPAQSALEQQFQEAIGEVTL